jgi:predicted Zn-dependent protease
MLNCFTSFTRSMRPLLAVTAMVLVGASLTACHKNIATGRNQLTFGMSSAEEVQLGSSLAPQFTAESGGAVKDAQLTNYVRQVGASLAAVTEGDNPRLPWEFTLLNTDDINAFALPGGKVFIAKGLAKRMTNEAQLAGVLGHEVGHVTARHTAERIGQSQAMNIGIGLSGILLQGASPAVAEAGSMAINLGGTLVPLKFSRDQESEADDLGLRYMTRIGYDPAGLLQVMGILKEASKGQSQPEILATHPLPETRIERIRKAIQTTYRGTQNNPQFQLHEQRFRQTFLARVAVIEAQEAAQQAIAAAGGAESSPPKAFARFGGQHQPGPLNLDDPTTWCLHCMTATQ